MDRINIIMAVYNGEKYLKELIDSIISNTFVNWRLFIYDDGSVDQSKDIIDGYVKNEGKRIFYIKNEKNKGLVRNFLEGTKEIINFGDLTKQDYFMFCDQDDVWLNEKLEKTLEHMKMKEKSNLPIAVYTDAYVVDKDLNIKETSFFKSNNLNTNTTDFNHLLMENRLIGCTVMFNYFLYQKLDILPRNARYHDWWIGLIASGFGKVSYLDVPTLLYRQHGGNQVGNKSFRGYVKKSILTLNKQKISINESIQQAEEFNKIYGNNLGKSKQLVLTKFTSLNTFGWIKRRYTILRYGFVKSGLIRNIGLLIII